MVKILSIEKKRNKYNINTSIGEYIFTEDVLVKYFINKNKKFTKEEFDEILSYSKKSEFYNKTLNFLSYKDRSVNEVRDYLVNKECKIVDEIINELINKKLLDDNRYANLYLDSCINNLKGPLYLKQELYKKGITEDMINNCLIKYSLDLVNSNLNILIDKELRKKQITSFNKYKQKLTSKFLRLGYKISSINNVINDRKDDLINNVDEEKSLENDFYKLENKGLNKDKLIIKLVNKGHKYTNVLNIVNNYNK